MFLLRFATKILLSIVVIAVVCTNLFGQELITTHNNNRSGLAKSPVYFTHSAKIVKNAYDKALADSAMTFTILDSLQNAYSYFSNEQQPFIYCPAGNTLATIKRGALPANGTPGNTLNDLKLWSSTDWGYTWKRIDDLYTGSTDAGARYPSVTGFWTEPSMSYIFTAPLTNNITTSGNNGWQGFTNGLIYQDAASGSCITSLDNQFTVNGNHYYWTGTDSHVWGWNGTDNNPHGMAVGNLSSTALDLTDNSNIGRRVSKDSWAGWDVTIPAQWAANKFITPIHDPSGSLNDSNNKSSSAFQMKDDNNGNLYLAAIGRFVAGTKNQNYYPGVSKSSDNGATWSDFDVFPSDALDKFIYSKGFDDTTLYLTVNRDFVPLANGDYSYVFEMYEDTTKTFNLYSNAYHGIVELYKTGNLYNIREIARTTGYTLAYWDTTLTPPGQSSNQLSRELQITRTIDGNKLVCKWVDFISAQDSAGNIVPYVSTDVFVSARVVGHENWSNPQNVTNNLLAGNHIWYSRITWLPTFIPNDMVNIPLLKVETIPNQYDTDSSARMRQRILNTQPQYVKIGHFTIDPLTLGVGGDNQANGFEINNIYPIPSQGETYVSLNLPVSGYLLVDIYDIMGKKVMNVHNGDAPDGFSSIKFNTGQLPSGAYMLSTTFNGKTATKLINVLH